MTWPAPDDLRDAKKKLESQSDPKLQQAIDLAVNEILSVLSGRYDVSGWTATTPPALFTLAVEMAYGHAGRATHTGDRGTPSDDTAKQALEEARAQLNQYLSGARPVLNSSGTRIAALSVPGSSFQRVTEPIFGMRDPTTWGISDASASARRGGVDGFGVP